MKRFKSIFNLASTFKSYFSISFNRIPTQVVTNGCQNNLLSLLPFFFFFEIPNFFTSS